MTIEQPELIYVGRSQKSDSFSWEEGTDGPRGYGSFLGVTDTFYIMIWGMVYYFCFICINHVSIKYRKEQFPSSFRATRLLQTTRGAPSTARTFPERRDSLRNESCVCHFFPEGICQSTTQRLRRWTGNWPIDRAGGTKIKIQTPLMKSSPATNPGFHWGSKDLYCSIWSPEVQN